MDEESKIPTAAQEELSVEYANNTLFEPTVWDLKILFGEFSARANSVDWHTSVTIPWAQAKLMAYYLELNVAAHEINTGSPIQIPSQVLPPEPARPSGADDTPENRAIYEVVKERRQSFMDSLKPGR